MKYNTNVSQEKKKTKSHGQNSIKNTDLSDDELELLNYQTNKPELAAPNKENQLEADCLENSEVEAQGKRGENRRTTSKFRKIPTAVLLGSPEKPSIKSERKENLIFEYREVPFKKIVLLFTTICLIKGSAMITLTIHLLYLIRFKLEPGFSDHSIAYLQSAIIQGAVFGSLSFIIIGDYFGRLKNLHFSLLLAFILSIYTSYNASIYILFQALIGFFLSIAWLSATALILETLSKTKSLCILTSSFIFGLILRVVPLIIADETDYVNRNSNTFLWLSLTKASIIAMALGTSFFLPESPKYLASSNQKEQFAKEMLQDGLCKSKANLVFDTIEKFRENPKWVATRNLFILSLLSFFLSAHYSVISDMDPYIFSYYVKKNNLLEYDYIRNYESLRTDLWIASVSEIPPLFCLLTVALNMEFDTIHLILTGNALTSFCCIIFLFKPLTYKIILLFVSKMFVNFTIIGSVLLIAQENSVVNVSTDLSLYWAALTTGRLFGQLVLPLIGMVSANLVISYLFAVSTIGLVMSCFLREKE